MTNFINNNDAFIADLDAQFAALVESCRHAQGLPTTDAVIAKFRKRVSADYRRVYGKSCIDALVDYVSRALEQEGWAWSHKTRHGAGVRSSGYPR